jgi:hypothetical protein
MHLPVEAHIYVNPIQCMHLDEDLPVVSGSVSSGPPPRVPSQMPPCVMCVVSDFGKFGLKLLPRPHMRRARRNIAHTHTHTHTHNGSDERRRGGEVYPVLLFEYLGGFVSSCKEERDAAYSSLRANLTYQYSCSCAVTYASC